jgi:hypothetical protein
MGGRPQYEPRNQPRKPDSSVVRIDAAEADRIQRGRESGTSDGQPEGAGPLLDVFNAPNPGRQPTTPEEMTPEEIEQEIRIQRALAKPGTDPAYELGLTDEFVPAPERGQSDDQEEPKR